MWPAAYFVHEIKKYVKYNKKYEIRLGLFSWRLYPIS
jgi:hypothetical protein